MEKTINNEELMKVVNLLKKDLSDHFGARIERIILYGSYARGDYNEDSDVDIMVLLNDLPVREDEKFVDRLSFDYMYDYTVLFSIMLQVNIKYNIVLDFYPYYQNIEKEGIMI